MTIDLTSMLINLSNSLLPVQSLLSGMGYLFGILMIISGVLRFKKVGESKGHSSGAEGMSIPIVFIGGGALLLYLPSSVSTLSNTMFGVTNVLSYSVGSEDPFYHAMELLIETAGLVWFVRGTVLLVNSSKPGEKEGSKGMTFLIAGIAAMNFNSCVMALDYAFKGFFATMGAIKAGTLWMAGFS